MTNPEFSYQFDVLYNNIMSNQAPGVNEYEKSVFLTLAQEQLVLAYYNGAASPNISFELTEEMRRYLSSLVKSKEITPDVLPTGSDAPVLLDKNSQLFTLPDKLWFITYEAGEYAKGSDPCLSEKTIEVIPVKQDDFHRVSENPFKRASSRRALRLDTSGNKVELVSNPKISKYLIRYIERLSPIILADLSEYGDNLTIGGISTETPCQLNECVHRIILEAAVELARQTMGRTFEKYQNNNQ